MEPIFHHAFITGSAKRLGRAMAEELLSNGVNLSAHYFTSKTEVEELSRWALAQKRGRVCSIHADLRNLDELSQAAQLSHQAFGPVDLLILSASDFYPTPLQSTSSSQWDYLFDLNLRAPYFLAQAFSKTMPKNGLIVFISDVHGTKPIKNYGPYCATKAGLNSLCKSLAKELAPKIRVNSISPGTILPQENSTPESLAQAANRSLLGKVGTPRDLVEGLLFLMNNQYLTGFDLIIDGGRALI